ncbi:MAG: SRPBCC domain-containing protein [Pseudomonadota bacterium]
MNASSPLPPVAHRVRVALAPPAAFDLFTRQIARWWPFVGHSCYGEEAVDIEFEPHEGGAVVEVARDGARMPWGRLTAWQPPHAFAMQWHPGLAPDQATRLSVRFVAVDGGTEVSVHHDGWESRGDQAAAKRDQYDGGWPATLAAFASLAGRGQKEATP